MKRIKLLIVSAFLMLGSASGFAQFVNNTKQSSIKEDRNIYENVCENYSRVSISYLTLKERVSSNGKSVTGDALKGIQAGFQRAINITGKKIGPVDIFRG